MVRSRVRYAAAAMTAALLLTACTGEAGSDAEQEGEGRLRTYYVAAEETVWGYAPDGGNEITGAPLDADAGCSSAGASSGLGRGM